MSTREKEDLQAMRMANVGQGKQEAAREEAWHRNAQREIAKNVRLFKRKEALRFAAKLLGCLLCAVVFVALDITDQIAGWIANLGLCCCVVYAALVIDRKERKV